MPAGDTMRQTPNAQQMKTGTNYEKVFRKDEKRKRCQSVRWLTIFTVGLMFFLPAKVYVAAWTPLWLERTITMSNVQGRIDHMAVDPAGERLFVAALGNNTVEVIDLRLGQQIRSIQGLNEPQGALYLSEFEKLFVTNGGDGSCKVFDGISLDLLDTINFSADADNIRYEPHSKQVYVGFGAGSIGTLDAKTGKRIWDVRLGGHPESFQLEESGKKIFVNVRPSKQVALIDSEKREVTALWPLKNVKDNFPMALDETNHRLFIGCRKPAKIIVYDTASGNAKGMIDIAGDVDDIFYDLKTKRLYASCGEGFLCVIQQIDPDHYLVISRIPTAKGARTSLFVPEHRRLYLAVPHREKQRAEVRVYTVQP
jgi:DNA-binding beta-propeller fold protein YncE